MVHPSYLLNPGDMFQVEVERVLYATGLQRGKRTKDDEMATHLIRGNDAFFNSKVRKTQQIEASTQNKEQKQKDNNDDAEETTEQGGETANKKPAKVSLDQLSPEAQWNLRERIFRRAIRQIKFIFQQKPEKLSIGDKVRLLRFRDMVSRAVSHSRHGELTVDQMMDAVEDHVRDVNARNKYWTAEVRKYEDSEQVISQPLEGEAREGGSATSTEVTKNDHSKSRKLPSKQIWRGLVSSMPHQLQNQFDSWRLASLDARDSKYLRDLLKRELEDPVDESKSYATPWQPRRYAGALAFIPRYLEVNPNVCAAVYLRHPVARKGMAEVPTPFNYFNNQLVHNWYARRG